MAIKCNNKFYCFLYTTEYIREEYSHIIIYLLKVLCHKYIFSIFFENIICLIYLDDLIYKNTTIIQQYIYR